MRFTVPYDPTHQTFARIFLGDLLNDSNLPLLPEERDSILQACAAEYHSDCSVTLYPLSAATANRFGFGNSSILLEVLPSLLQQMVGFSPIVFAAVRNNWSRFVIQGMPAEKSEIIFPFVIEIEGCKRSLFISIELPILEGELFPRTRLYTTFEINKQESERFWLCFATHSPTVFA
jgi:hypothetical protein